jgi:UDP-N-acetylmuramyl pentapeptide synthase
MGMRGLGEIKTLTHFIPPDLAVITNIGEAHIGLLGSKENIFKAKMELLQSLDKDGIAIINKDDHYFFEMSEIVKDKKVYTFSIENKSDIMARNIRIFSDEGMKFTLEVQNDKGREIYFPLLGRYNIYNALAASAVAFALGIELGLIERGLYDSYNASPLSVKGALETLTEVAQNNEKIAILGDMLELGEKTGFYHREIGKEVAKLSIDTLITVGQGGKIIAQSSKEEGMAEERVFSFENNEKINLAKKLLNLIKPGNFVLLKGSREMKMEEILEFWQKEYQKNNLPWEE